MEELYLPVLSHFQNGNVWTGSDGRLRYRITPGEEGLTAEAWEGPWACELSRVEEVTRFPLDEEGLRALAQWVNTWSAEINARPPESLAQAVQKRDALKAERAGDAAGTECSD